MEENSKKEVENKNEKKEKQEKQKAKVTAYFKDIWQDMVKRVTFLTFFIAPLITCLVIEGLNQRGFFKLLKFVVSQPLTLLVNYMIILFTLSFVLLLKRRLAPMFLICVVWIGFGVANFLLKGYRETPFSATDIKMATSVMGIIDKYLSGVQGVILIGLIIFAVVGIITAWIKVPKYAQKLNYVRNLIAIAFITVVMLLTVELGLLTGVVYTKYTNLSVAYLDNGFAYSFAISVVDVGISKPKGYDESTVKNIKENIDEKDKNNKNENTATDAPDGNITLDDIKDLDESPETPNIIFLQLESFFDVNKVKELELSQEATPIFNKLKEEYPSGYLSVNNVGYGTANTEFEMMTGMNLEDFGPGEFPYKTVLKENTCETIAYVLRDYGYSSHVIHNNNASFYSRHKVFRRMGMNSFTSVEFMNPTVYTETGWVEDRILIDEIMKVLNSTDDQDYIYTISVQGHGTYPTYEMLENPEITVSGIDDEERRYQFEFYVNQIHEMDDFIGELIDTLDSYKEDTILVMFGDHLPSLELTEDELENGDLFQTEYIIWSNYGFEMEDQDLETFQVYPKILEKLGIDGGIINMFHRTYGGAADYLEALKMLEYDMLYGEQYVFDGENPYVETDMLMGTYPIEIEDVAQVDKPETFSPNSANSSGRPETEVEVVGADDEYVYCMVKGNYFSPFSYVYVNDSKCETQFVDEKTLIVRLEEVQNLDVFKVKQLWKAKSSVAESEEYIFEATRTEE